MKQANLHSTTTTILAFVVGSMLLIESQVSSFVPTTARGGPSRAWGVLSASQESGVSTDAAAAVATTTSNYDGDDKLLQHQHQPSLQAIRAPLRYIGPYPVLPLAFPDLSTANLRQQNKTGISLDFVLDTAANVNTINAQVSQELGLPVVGSALPGVGSAGAISGGDTFLLGDARLQGLPDQEGNFTFMTGLTASALPIASPAAAGLLSLAFLQSFDGVDMDWGTTPVVPVSGDDDVDVSAAAARPPSITFHANAPTDAVLQGRTKVPLERIPITQLLSVTIQINGIDMPALLDTGSPITVMNAQAAKAAGIESIVNPLAKKGNPLQALQAKFELANAASRGDILQIFGAGGARVNLCKSIAEVDVTMQGGEDDDNETIAFGAGNVYVGDLPGLAALNGLGVKSPPAVVLGMDVLRRRPSMLLRASHNEVWF